MLPVNDDGLSKTSLGLLFEEPTKAESTPQSFPHSSPLVPELLPQDPCSEQFEKCASESLSSTLTGSLTFLLYHVVYCLAQASTITRPHADHSSVGVMAKMAAVGTLLGGPVFVFGLGVDVPAIYPASDLFLSPFLAQVAADIDASLYEHGLQNDDRVFLATFSALIGAGFLASGVLCILAARVKLANLGSFLPYCVLCGFFTTIGILIWSLGFSVDTGMKVGELVHYQGEESWWSVLGRALWHHGPSFAVGVTMHIVGQRNSLYVIALIFATLFASYAMLWATDTSLEEAQEMNWFFSSKELQDPPFFTSSASEFDDSWLSSWTVPAPLGVWAMLFHGDVHWPSFRAGISTMSALAFLYLIRCSLHSAALKKNIPNVTRKQSETVDPSSPKRSSFSLSLRGATSSTRSSSHRKHPPREPLSLGKILEKGYAYSQIVAALTGGIAVAPAVAASLTLFKLGCEGVGPQLGSIMLVSVFYVTDFQLVQYIPKPAVSCLMVLAGLDMCKTWLVSSYFKTKAKLEWMVAPVIVVLAFTVGMLNAIFLGVAISTFIFVASFYKAGTVKFVGNGLNLRSTVERGVPENHWLNKNGDLIQILVLQQFLFFGNAQSVLHYVTTMFEEDPKGDDDDAPRLPLPPKPRYLVLDFAWITGMDTSALDILKEISALCRSHSCRLFFSGLSPSLRSMLVYAKLSPAHEKRTLLFAPDLESALAKAEDGLINRVSGLRDQDESEYPTSREQEPTPGDEKQGFLHALQKIDDQHGLNTRRELSELWKYTTVTDLKANQLLPRENQSHHGLFFIEFGQLRIVHNSDYATTTTIQPTFPSPRQASMPSSYHHQNSIGQLNARSETLGRQTAMQKRQGKGPLEMKEQSFRLARVGPGWVVGTIEECSGLRQVGAHVAVTPCRLHHLHKESMKQIEKSNPSLALETYKLMSWVANRRQEMTIAQLAQFVNIMNAPSPNERVSPLA